MEARLIQRGGKNWTPGPWQREDLGSYGSDTCVEQALEREGRRTAVFANLDVDEQLMATIRKVK
jgi:hypothetical protein